MARKQTDWAPRGREELIAMAKQWNKVLSEKGSNWDISFEDFKELPRLTSAAEEALAIAYSAERTTTSTGVCEEAFNALLKYMRNLKQRKFFSPPLLDSDFISLLLAPRKKTRTPTNVPTGYVTGEVSYPGPPHRLKVRIIRLAASENDPRADYGYRIYYGIMPQGGAALEQAAGIHRYLMKAPVSGAELPFSIFTRRQTEYVDIDAEDAGKTIFFCIRYENSKGKAGPWGPIFSAVIP